MECFISNFFAVDGYKFAIILLGVNCLAESEQKKDAQKHVVSALHGYVQCLLKNTVFELRDLGTLEERQGLACNGYRRCEGNLAIDRDSRLPAYRGAAFRIILQPLFRRPVKNPNPSSPKVSFAAT